MSIISPADLEASPLADLHALASALGIDGFRRLRKEELAEAIRSTSGPFRVQADGLEVHDFDGGNHWFPRAFDAEG